MTAGLAKLVALAGCCVSATAHAQQPADRAADVEPPEQAEITAPRVLVWIDAVYPRGALASRIEGTVVLRLSIDKEGKVTDAEVAEPAGYGFDEAAAAAVRQFQFEPARRDGRAVGARLLFRYTFHLPEAPAPGQPPAAPPPSAAPPGGGGAATEAAPTARAAAPQKSVQVTVQGRQAEAQRRRDSAEAVTVISTYRAKQQTRDLADVLSRVEGVSIRRTGGLGSFIRISLNGLSDEQIRFFVDEVPLDIAGYPFGIASVPVNLVENIEIYRGILPVRYGADALGGAINLVPDERYETGISASYQRGMFGTHQATLRGRYRHAPTGFIAGASGWIETTRNDYEVEVEIPDRTGRTRPERVRRFHDGYRAYGGSLEFGAVETPWASRFVVNLFGATLRKEIQNNVYMTIPFGEAEFGSTVFGGTVRYEHALGPDVSISAVASGSRRVLEFYDVSDGVYDWYGRLIGHRAKRGEVLREPHDATIWQDNVFGRAQVEWRPLAAHALRVASTGRFFHRTGEELHAKGPGGIDPLAGPRDLFTLMTGIEYEINAFGMRTADRGASTFDPSRDHRLQNIVFAKHYLWSAGGEDVVATGKSTDVDFTKQRFGFGDGLRFRFTDWMMAKASYELTTRLPNVDELYGNGVDVSANVDLVPESSHNANLGVRLGLPLPLVGRVGAEANGFLRTADALIKQLPISENEIRYENIASASALGVEGSLSWASPGNWVLLDGTATWQDVRNTATEGTYGKYEGDRIPNQPWLFATWAGRIQWRGVLMREDELSPFYVGRCVHEFFRTWESIGSRKFKLTVPTHVEHSAGLSYEVREPLRATVTFEVKNLLDERLFDFFGVQKPGRSVALKVMGEL